MKKVGILTITDGANYGNRLQNYAMQKMVASMGFQVETIRRRTDRDENHFCMLAKYLIKRIIGRPSDIGQRKRKMRFEAFNRKYIHFSSYVLHDNVTPSGLKEGYDFFVVGSDQVWNARIAIVRQDIKNYLASFAKPEQKIAFAASFGTDDILPEFQNLYKEELSSYKAIGVRETSGVSIIKNLCGRDDVKTVLDPTMMLTSEEWMELEQKPQYVDDEKFIVTYFLGGRSQQICAHIEEVAKKYNAKIINLEIEFLFDVKIENSKFFETNPNEFLWLIHHAECVLTDSFHATVFSILFEKPFLVYERIAAEKNNDMSSRIDTLLSKFNLQECRDNINEPTQIPVKPDYSTVEKQLQTERKEATDFIREALEVI